MCPAGCGKNLSGRRGRRPLRRVTSGCCMSGRCRHRPLRKRYKGCNGRATARVAPTKTLQETREKNPPVTVSPCQPPLGKGAKDGGYGLPQPVTSVTGFAMTGFLQEVRCKSGGGVRAPRPTERFVGADDPVRPGPITQRLVGQGPCALPWVREKFGSGRRGRRPLRRVTRGCGMSGRCRHRPLRKRYKGCNGRATARVAPTEGYK